MAKAEVGMVMVVVLVWVAVGSVWDNNLHVIVCDVGQGDAILIRQGRLDMLVDGGPNDRVLDCLAKYMPWYDRTIELVILTHPHADHMQGLIEVADKYKVMTWATVDVVETETIKIEDIQPSYLVAGNKIRLGKITFDVIWPSAEYVKRFNKGDDLNSVAVVGLLRYGALEMLLTGDADAPVDLAMTTLGLLTDVDVLKVPHHGSKTGMTQAWLETVNPEIAIISVGRNNKYGHPGEEAIKMLQDKGIKIFRTDIDGDVEVVSDGEQIWVI